MSDDDGDWSSAVVIDNGSGSIQAGFAGDDAPRSFFESVVGRPRFQKQLHGITYSDRYVGDKAMSLRGVLSLRYPIERGIVKNWDDMELIWQHVFENELRTKSDKTNVFITDAILNPVGNREKMAQIMLEKFNVLGFFVINHGIPTIFASGRACGTVVNIGEGVAQVYPIYEGYTVLSAMRRLDLAGRDLTSYLQRLLQQKGYSFTTSAEMELVKKIKEDFCFVSKNFENDLVKASSSFEIEKSYTLPDGNEISVGDERIRCPEALFQPSLLGLESGGIHELINNCILSCDIDLRSLLYTNVILAGGTTMCPGIEERLSSTLKALAPSSFVKVVAPPERRYSTWIGGSIQASLSTFQKCWITPAEYQEYGPNIVHRKCKYETSSDDECVSAVVIDNGSWSFLAGLSGDDSPSAILRPSAIGRRRFQERAGISDEDTYIGDKLNEKQELLSLTYPVERGIVTNWDDMEKIWQYAFERELRVKSEDSPVLMADATLNPIGNREKMIQVMMESFHVPGFQVMNQGILSMYANGRTSGTIVTVGEGVCHVDPIYEAVPDLLGRRRVELAGRDLTLHLQRLLHNKGYSFTSSAEIELVRDMKEKLCYVSFNVEKDRSTASTSSDLDKSYTLPDGNKLTLNTERFMCPEALFQPSLLGLDFKGIHHLVNESILACDICTRRDLFYTIILSGASTMFRGFQERLMHEIMGLAPLPLKVMAPPERNKSAWLGGSIVASLSSFDKHLISRQEYEEFGPGIVHRKCRYY
ncbi:uncharacterized protein LOC134241839 [Saccostrea cucullata]|uniref:uncharacterized protein LOC134241839 n=1 Tax=Saccostrea cuccullata TaxID=36930 RepID=UPI002ED13E61